MWGSFVCRYADQTGITDGGAAASSRRLQRVGTLPVVQQVVAEFTEAGMTDRAHAWTAMWDHARLLPPEKVQDFELRYC